MAIPTVIQGRQGDRLVWRSPVIVQADGISPVRLLGSDLLLTITDAAGVTILTKVSTRALPPSGGLAIADAANGRVYLELNEAETLLLPVGRMARFRLARRYQGAETTIASGYFNILKGTASHGA